MTELQPHKRLFGRASEAVERVSEAVGRVFEAAWRTSKAVGRNTKKTKKNQKRIIDGLQWNKLESADGIAIAIANSFYVVFCSMLAPIPDFIQSI